MLVDGSVVRRAAVKVGLRGVTTAASKAVQKAVLLDALKAATTAVHLAVKSGVHWAGNWAEWWAAAMGGLRAAKRVVAWAVQKAAPMGTWMVVMTAARSAVQRDAVTVGGSVGRRAEAKADSMVATMVAS